MCCGACWDDTGWCIGLWSDYQGCIHLLAFTGCLTIWYQSYNQATWAVPEPSFIHYCKNAMWIFSPWLTVTLLSLSPTELTPIVVQLCIRSQMELGGKYYNTTHHLISHMLFFPCGVYKYCCSSTAQPSVETKYQLCKDNAITVHVWASHVEMTGLMYYCVKWLHAPACFLSITVKHHSSSTQPLL